MAKNKGKCDSTNKSNVPYQHAMYKRDQELEATIQKELEQTKEHGLETKPFISSYTHEIGQEICVRVAFGQSLKFICNLEHMPTYWCLNKWLYGQYKEHTEHGGMITQFRAAYHEAQCAQRELLGDEMIPIADEAWDRDSAAAAKIKLQARQFKLERLDPKNWAAATRAIEDETVENFADKMVDALEIIAQRRAERELPEDSSQVVALGSTVVVDTVAKEGNGEDE